MAQPYAAWADRSCQRLAQCSCSDSAAAKTERYDDNTVNQHDCANQYTINDGCCRYVTAASKCRFIQRTNDEQHCANCSPARLVASKHGHASSEYHYRQKRTIYDTP